MANLTSAESNGWDGIERRAAGSNPNRISIVLTRVRRPTSMQCPPQLCAASPASAHEQSPHPERQAEAMS